MEGILRDLLALVEEKEMKMQGLVRLLSEQTRLLVEENVEDLEALIEHQQYLMDDIDQLDLHVQRLQESLPLEGGANAPNDSVQSATARRILEARSRTRETVAQAMEIDQQNSQLSGRLLDKLRRVMQDNQRAAHAAQAYSRGNQASEVPSIYTNRKV